MLFRSDTQNAAVANMLAEGNSANFITFTLGSTTTDGSTGGGGCPEPACPGESSELTRSAPRVLPGLRSPEPDARSPRSRVCEPRARHWGEQFALLNLLGQRSSPARFASRLKPQTWERGSSRG